MEEVQKVGEWLKSLGLAQYYQNFIDNGYDNLTVLKINGLENEDFDILKIDKIGHRKCLLTGLKKLDSFTEDEPKSDSRPSTPSMNRKSMKISVDSNDSDLNDNNSLRIEQEHLDFVRTLASGEFGITNLVRFRGKEVVSKQLKNVQQINDFLKEAKLMSKIPPHPNVVQFLGVVQDSQGVTNILMEFVPLGDLQMMLLNNPNALTHDVILDILIGISSGMMHLHSCGIVHRDLAPRNVLIDGQFQPKITDFGLARETTAVSLDAKTEQVYQSMKSLYGEDVKMPIFIMAPESLQGNIYTKMTDVWAFAVLAFQLATQQLPYPTVTELIQLRDHHKEFPSKKLEKRGIPQQLIQLLIQCHSRNPDSRPSFSQIYTMLTQFKFQMKEQALIKELQQKEAKLQHALAEKDKELATAIKNLKEAETKGVVEVPSSDNPLESCWFIPTTELLEINTAPKEDAEKQERKTKEEEKDKSNLVKLKNKTIKAIYKKTDDSNNNNTTTNRGSQSLSGSSHALLNMKRWLKDVTVCSKKIKNNAPVHAEIEKFCRLRHANIVSIYGFTNLNGALYYIREYVKGVNLSDYINQNASQINRPQSYHILLSIIDGLLFLHGRKLIHGNLKPSNILVESNPNPNEPPLIRLVDPIPGAQATLDSIHQKTAYDPSVTVDDFFTLQYCPDEYLKSNKLTEAVDVFSFGLIMYEVLEKKEPSKPLPSVKASEFQPIVSSCVCHSPLDRPSMSTVRKKLAGLKNPPLHGTSYTGFTEDERPIPEQIDSVFKASGKNALSTFDFDIKVVQGILKGSPGMASSLDILLKEKRTNEIPLQNWNNFATWFTPLQTNENYVPKPANWQPGYTMNTIVEIVGHKWFFGFYSAVDAANVLSSMPEGGFMFRFSSKEKSYSLSVKSDSVYHWRITVDEDWDKDAVYFKIDNRRYKSLLDIVETHKSAEKLTAKGVPRGVYLSHPADRTKYL